MIVGIILGIIVFVPLIYGLLSIQFVKPNEKAYLYFLDRPKRAIKSGINFVPEWFAYLVKFPTGIQTAKLIPEDVMIAATENFEEESQPITVDVRQPFLFKNIRSIYIKLGARDINKVMSVLFGELTDGTWKGGLAGEKIASITREYVASDEVKTLDDAYKMRENLGEKILKKLIAELPLSEFGIEWRPTIIYDVSARPEIINAREKKAEEAILRDKARITAQTTVVIAKAEADGNRAKGQAEADVNLAKGEAQAKVDFARLNAKLQIINETNKVSFDGAGRILAILLFGTEMAEKIKDVGKLNLFMAPNLSEILGQIFGSAKTVTAESLIKIFSTLNTSDKEKIKSEILQMIGGK